MRVVVDQDIKDALRPLTPNELADLRAKIIKEGCNEKFPYAVIDGVPTQLDAHHRRDICTEEKIAYEWAKIPGITTKDEAISWVLEHQIARRNLSPKEAAQVRSQRIARVQEAAEKGESIRKIAKREKVSPRQIQRDLGTKPDSAEAAKKYAANRLKKLDYREGESMFHSIDRDSMEEELVNAFLAGADAKEKAAVKPCKKFVPPTLEEVAAYCKERKNNVDPAKFLAHYESNGWKVGRNPMKNWKAAVHTWENSGLNNGPPEPFSGLKEFLGDNPNEPHPADKK